MNKINYEPCKDCKERKINCHTNCEKYEKFKFISTYYYNKNIKKNKDNRIFM